MLNCIASYCGNILWLIWGLKMFFEDFISYKTKLSTLDCYSNFLKVMNYNEEFIDYLIEQVFDKPVICISGSNTYITDTLFLRTAIRTLNSISVCCSYGCFADSSVLVRKYRDDLFQYLFIIEVLNNRKVLTNDEISELIPGAMDVDKFCALFELSMKINVDGSRKDRNDKAVDAWFDNKVLTGEFRKELSIENYLNYLKQNPNINKCILEHGLNDIWESIRRRLNNYTHTNGKKFIEHNLLEYLSTQEIEKCFLEISEEINYITSSFLVFLILIKPEFIMSSDYIDNIELGFEPPDGSQYWVAPFIKEYININIFELHPELKSFLHNNNKYGMLIE